MLATGGSVVDDDEPPSFLSKSLESAAFDGVDSAVPMVVSCCLCYNCVGLTVTWHWFAVDFIF